MTSLDLAFFLAGVQLSCFSMQLDSSSLQPNPHTMKVQRHPCLNILILRATVFCAAIICAASAVNAQSAAPRFKVVAFYTGTSDQAHISFVREANRWFPAKAATCGFSYEATT